MIMIVFSDRETVTFLKSMHESNIQWYPQVWDTLSYLVTNNQTLCFSPFEIWLAVLKASPQSTLFFCNALMAPDWGIGSINPMMNEPTFNVHTMVVKKLFFCRFPINSVCVPYWIIVYKKKGGSTVIKLKAGAPGALFGKILDCKNCKQ